MSEVPLDPDGLSIQQTRVYYDRASGQVVHIHSLVTPPDEELDAERVEEEMAEFARALADRHERDLGFIVVDEAELLDASSPNLDLFVDTETKRISGKPASA